MEYSIGSAYSSNTPIHVRHKAAKSLRKLRRRIKSGLQDVLCVENHYYVETSSCAEEQGLLGYQDVELDDMATPPSARQQDETQDRGFSNGLRERYLAKRRKLGHARKSTESSPTRWRNSLATSIASYDYRRDAHVPQIDISTYGVGMMVYYF